MSTDSTPKIRLDTGEGFLAEDAQPGLLLAHCSGSSVSPDRAPITPVGVVIGRGPEADWHLPDPRLSKQHVRFWLSADLIMAQDLGSTNGCYLNGHVLSGPGSVVKPGDILRCGCTIVSVTGDLRTFASGLGDTARHGLAGPFYSPVLLADLLEAVAVGRHVLLTGDSGTGKELAARALAAIRAERGLGSSTILAHNCATFANEEEATTTIFGVTNFVFSGVKARAGLLERAGGGVLFLDEIHALPVRVQQSLLRFVEDGQLARIGDCAQRRVEVSLVLGTNRRIREAVAQGQIAFDLVNRLQRVHMIPLAARRADVPDIFLHYLADAAHRHGLDARELQKTTRPTHLEAICLIDFQERNVRELILLAEAFCARLATRRIDPQTALGRILADRYPDNPVVLRALASLSSSSSPSSFSFSPSSGSSHSPRRRRSPAEGHSAYERNKTAIIEAYNRAHGNLSECERLLKADGFPGSRRWLAKYLEEWGVR